MKGSSKWGFGTEKRRSLEARDAAKTPSPNQYKIPQRITEGPKFGMGIKLKPIDSSNSKIGPGQYDTMNIDNIRMKGKIGFSLGKSKRSETALSLKVPGPGQYDTSMVDKRSDPRYGFGSSKRPSPAPTKSASPGPGNYSLRSIVGNEGRKTTMHSKVKGVNIDKNPGPGNYDVNSSAGMRKAPSFAMGVRLKERSPDRSPGPGAHNPNTGSNLVLAQGARYGFGSAKRRPV
jgi:hypothetical protein